MIKASSLVYAVFICLLVSIMTGGLIYWAKLSNDLSTNNQIKEALIDHCESCFNYTITSLKTTQNTNNKTCLLYTSPSPRDRQKSRMPSSA